MTEPADTPVAGLGDPTWLRWAKALRSVAQAGLTYSESPFDRDRYSQVQAIGRDGGTAGRGRSGRGAPVLCRGGGV